MKSADGVTLSSITLNVPGAQGRKRNGWQKNPGAICGPGNFTDTQTLLNGCLLNVVYWTFNATSSITNEVCRLVSSTPRKRICMVCPLNAITLNERCV
jgi:hypothetical protein